MILSLAPEVTEIKEVYDFLSENLKPWTKDLDEHARTASQDVHWVTLPWLALLINRYFGNQRIHELYLSTIFSLLYFSDHIHGKVLDDQEGQSCNQTLQFSILLGDLIFGKAIQLLLKMDEFELLPYMTSLIAHANEGHVISRKTGADDLDTIGLEKALYYKTLFLTASIIGGCSGRELKLYEDIGYSLGMVITLQDRGMSAKSLPYLEKAEALLANQRRSNYDKCGLHRMIDELHDGLEIPRAVI
ncbi:MAG: hypothetical protein ACM3MK_14175 [Chitinophagales bacterium]